MKISENYILREIAGDYIIVPSGREALHFQGLITVNETGVFLWKLLQEKECNLDELVEAVCHEFEVSEKMAREDIREFLGYIKQRGIIEEEGIEKNEENVYKTNDWV